jgi:hypothetical protein
MQVLNGRYAQLFNQRHDRDGHLFRARYSVYVMTMRPGSRRAVSTSSRTRFAQGSAKKPSDWHWSRCRALANRWRSA